MVLVAVGKGNVLCWRWRYAGTGGWIVWIGLVMVLIWSLRDGQTMGVQC